MNGKPSVYTLRTDGGSRGNPGPAAYGAVLYLGEKVVWLSGKYLGKMTNNEAEYHGIIRGLLMAKGKGVKKLIVYIDSELAFNQITSQWKIKNYRIKALKEKVKTIKTQFDFVEFKHNSRERNILADRIVNLILDSVEPLVKMKKGRF